RGQIAVDFTKFLGLLADYSVVCISHSLRLEQRLKANTCAALKLRRCKALHHCVPAEGSAQRSIHVVVGATSAVSLHICTARVTKCFFTFHWVRHAVHGPSAVHVENARGERIPRWVR